MSASRPTLTVTSVTIACPAPRELAAFYAKLLDTSVGEEEPPREGEPPEAGWAQLRAGELTLNFEWDRHWARPVWPSQSGAQTATEHLDIMVDDLQGAIDWASECGATAAEFQPQEDVRVMIDPQGHPFCLFA